MGHWGKLTKLLQDDLLILLELLLKYMSTAVQVVTANRYATDVTFIDPILEYTGMLAEASLSCTPEQCYAACNPIEALMGSRN